jgi:2-keto-4-pentenoate hydratase
VTIGSRTQRIAADLFEGHKNNRKFHALPRTELPDLATAYDVQDEFVAHLCEDERAEVVGYKIGLTSPTMQRMCGIDTPIAGVILSSRVFSNTVIKRENFGRLGLEFEFGIRLGRDLTREQAPFDFESIASAVDRVCAAVELVDDRDADYRQLDVHTLVADNSWNGGAILGKFSSSWPNLGELEGIVTCDGQEIGRGYGSDLMGHPFSPLVWLVNHLTDRGTNVRAGSVILTGSLVQTQFPKRSHTYCYSLGHLGSLSLNIV